MTDKGYTEKSFGEILDRIVDKHTEDETAFVKWLSEAERDRYMLHVQANSEMMGHLARALIVTDRCATGHAEMVARVLPRLTYERLTWDEMKRTWRAGMATKEAN